MFAVYIDRVVFEKGKMVVPSILKYATMKKNLFPALFPALFFAGFLFLLSCNVFDGKNNKPEAIGILSNDISVNLIRNPDDSRGISLNDAGFASIIQNEPVIIELYLDSQNTTTIVSGYKEVEKNDEGFTGKTLVETEHISFDVSDQWNLNDQVLTLTRRVKVNGQIPNAGFLSAIKFNSIEKLNPTCS